MLAILVTHPIQYHVPLWQMLAKDGRVPFEVWYLSEHATRVSRDREFGQQFAWDLDMLKGYPHRFLKAPAGATPNTFWRCRVAESLPKLFQETQTKVLWAQGWQVAVYWQSIWAAHKAGVRVWLRGESNILKQRAGSREPATAGSSIGEHGASKGNLTSDIRPLTSGAKRLLLGQLFKRVDHFLCIGTANRDLYRSYGVPESKLQMTPYAVDNERFASQARELEDRRWEIRKQWGIPQESFCVLFCGKFIPKKRPMDVIRAAQLLITDNSITDNRVRNVHVLFAGSGELGGVLRAECDVVFDEEQGARSKEQGASKGNLTSDVRPPTSGMKPRASFAGFLNQTEVSSAYVAADVLVLPSDYDETWGLVVNEAMASGLPCIISDRCGCAPDLGAYSGNSVFRFGDVAELARQLLQASANKDVISEPPSFQETVGAVCELYPNTAVGCCELDK